MGLGLLSAIRKTPLPPHLRHALLGLGWCLLLGVGVVLGTFPLEVAPPGGHQLPLGYLRKSPKSSHLEAEWLGIQLVAPVTSPPGRP